MVATRILILLITLLFVTSLNSMAQYTESEEDKRFRESYEEAMRKSGNPVPPPVYKDKVEIMGQPLDKRMQDFLLNKRWCSEPILYDNTTYTKFKGNVYNSITTYGNDSGLRPSENKVVITMLNDKEFVIMTISKYGYKFSDNIPTTYPDETISQTVYRIVNENQYGKVNRFISTKENNRWKVEKDHTKDVVPNNIHSNNLCN